MFEISIFDFSKLQNFIKNVISIFTVIRSVEYITNENLETNTKLDRFEMKDMFVPRTKRKKIFSTLV